MRTILLLISIAVAPLVASVQAEARGHYRHVSRHHFGHHLAARHFSRSHVRTVHATGGKPSCFWTAAAQGGPCGCWAEWKLLGRVEHVLRDARGTWNPWLADDWRRHFPRSSPELATAAVWPGRHVAPIKPGTYRAGSVVVLDSWGEHRVRTAGLVLVNTGRKADRPGVRYSSGSLG